MGHAILLPRSWNTLIFPCLKVIRKFQLASSWELQLRETYTSVGASIRTIILTSSNLGSIVIYPYHYNLHLSLTFTSHTTTYCMLFSLTPSYFYDLPSLKWCKLKIFLGIILSSCLVFILFLIFKTTSGLERFDKRQ